MTYKKDHTIIDLYCLCIMNELPSLFYLVSMKAEGKFKLDKAHKKQSLRYYKQN